MIIKLLEKIADDRISNKGSIGIKFFNRALDYIKNPDFVERHKKYIRWQKTNRKN